MPSSLLQSLPSTIRRKAEKCSVRECDETEPGVFIAYVDSGDETFDVSVTLKNEALVNSSCDCRKAAVCEHKAALLMYLSNPPAKKTAAVKAKKQDPLLALLQDSDPLVLKQWLSELIVNNKDIRLAFELQFAQAGTLTIEEIAQKTANALKTVVKNKKNVDVNQLKKIVDLWTKIHDPIVRDYYNAVFSQDPFDRFHSAMKACALEQERISTLSNKIPMYLSERILKSLEPIHQLQQEDKWQAAIGLVFSGMKTSTHLLKMTYLELLKNLYFISEADRNENLVRQLMGRFNEIVSIHPYYNKEVAEFFLKMINEARLFEKYWKSFSAIDYAQTYNNLLIDALISIKQFDIAERICLNEIKFHTRNNERPAYYRSLINIYTIQDNEKQLLETVKRLFPYTFDFSDFRFVYDRLKTTTDKSSWRSVALKTVLSGSRQMHVQAMDFQLQLALQEKDMNRSLHLVEHGCPYLVISKHAAALIDQFGDSFLFALINRYEDHFYIMNNKQMEAEMSSMGEVINVLMSRYGPEKLLAYLEKMKEKRKVLRSELPATLYSLLT